MTQVESPIFQFAGMTLDEHRGTLTRVDEQLFLRPKAFTLLLHLARNAGRVVTRTMLLEQVWDYHFDPGTNVIDVHVSRLRRKIEDGFDNPILHTVRGAGYRLAAS